MKVLVTGAGSLLMGGVAAALVARGDDVVCLQRRPASFPGAQHTEQVLADVRDADRVAAAVRGCDAVVHGAARVGVTGTWDDVASVNVDGTAHVLAAVRTHGIGRLVHVSTPSVAHTGSSLVGEAAAPAATGRRRAYYAESKALAERAVLAAADGSIGVTAVRPHLVWGPGDTQLVGRIVERARQGRLAVAGTGAALVDTTYLDNAVDALVAALDAVRPGAACDGHAYVVSNGEPRTVLELMQRICAAAGIDATPRRVPLRAALVAGSLAERLWALRGDTEPPLTRFVAEQLGTAHWFDISATRADLGWTPRVGLDEGFTRLAAWYGTTPPDTFR